MSTLITLAILLQTATVPEPAALTKAELKRYDWCSKFHRSKHPKPTRTAPGTPTPLPAKKTPWVRHVLGQGMGGLKVTAPKSLILRRDTLAGGHAAVTLSYKKHHEKDPMRVLARGWQPALQFRTYPLPLKAVVAHMLKELKQKAGGLYGPSLVSQTRKVGATTELCVHVVRIPGHMTMVGGRHRPLPPEYDVFHAFLWEAERKVFATTYRVPERDGPTWWPLFQRIVTRSKRP